jgi:polyvinyl alcohol dehydrogenase (cytochrome)
LVGEGSKDGRYYALARQTLQPVWQAVLGPGSLLGGVLGSTAYDGTRIYGTDALTGVVTALARDGAVDWTSNDHGTFELSPVALANGVLYSVDPTGLLVARDASTGAVLNSLALGGPSAGGASVADGRVFVSVGQGEGPQPGSIVAFSAGP